MKKKEGIRRDWEKVRSEYTSSSIHHDWLPNKDLIEFDGDELQRPNLMKL